MAEARRGIDGLEDSVTTQGVTDCLDMESGRLLYDDGRTWARRPAAAKSQEDSRVGGRAATGPDARLHIRQGGRGNAQNRLWTNAVSEDWDVGITQFR